MLEAVDLLKGVSPAFTHFDRTFLILRLLIRFWDLRKALPRARQHLHPVHLFTTCPPRLMLDLNHNLSVRSHLPPCARIRGHRTPLS